LIDSISKDFNPKNVDNTIARLLNPEKNDVLRSNVMELLKVSGEKPEKLFNDLVKVRAARELTPFVIPGRTGISAPLTAMYGPRATGLGVRTWGKLQTQSRATQFIGSLNSMQRKELLQNPEALRSLTQIIVQTGDQVEGTREQLTQEGVRKVRGQ